MQRVARRWLRLTIRRAAIEKRALRKKQLLQMMSKGKTFGVISAYTGTSKHENQQRHGKLMADLQKLGYRKVHTLKAKWEGESGTYHEKSLLIPNIKPQQLFDLGVKYEQDATIYKSGDGILGMYYPGGNYAEVAVDAKAMPEFQTAADKGLFSKDRNWSFEFGFAWGEHLPWDGRSAIGRKQVRQWLAAKETEAS
jgi:hypothetical protein